MENDFSHGNEDCLKDECRFYEDGECNWRETETPPTVAVDLDGTLLDYDGWNGENHFGDLKDGAKECLEAMEKRGYQVIIHTCRKDRDAVRNHLEDLGAPFDAINRNPAQCPALGKLLADYYVDDRGVRFDGDWGETTAEILGREHKRKASDELEERILGLHALGKNDREIAEKLGVSPVTVHKKRRKLDLERNAEPMNRKVSDDEVRRLHASGKNDREIAVELGVHRTTIHYRRKKLGLEPNSPPSSKKFSDEDLRELHAEGLSDREMADELRVHRTTVRKRRRKLDLPVNCPPSKSGRSDQESVSETLSNSVSEAKTEGSGEEGGKCVVCGRPTSSNRRLCHACGGFEDKGVGYHTPLYSN